MNKKRVFGAGLIILGIALFLVRPASSITGMAIASEAVSSLGSLVYLLGICFMIVGAGVLLTSGLEQVVEDIGKEIETQREKHPGNPKYLTGLREIEKYVHEDTQRYNSAESPELKNAIHNRLNRWKEGLIRREQVFFNLPHHVKGKGGEQVIDLPDNGLYAYLPMEGKKSKLVELKVTHYTDKQPYEQIKTSLKGAKDRVMFADQNGWTYFTAQPLEEGLTVRTLRRVLGTGLQDYAGKTRVRNPEYQVTFTVKVPKERVLEKIEDYNLGDNKRISVKKYAIAGGISSKDVISGSVAYGGRYASKNLGANHYEKESWKIAEAA
jgi:hypothetical protein